MNHAQNKIKTYLDEHGYEGYVTRNELDIRWVTRFKGSFGLYVQHCDDALLYTDARYIESAHALPGAGVDFRVVEFTRETLLDIYSGTFVVETNHTLSQHKGIKKIFPQASISISEPFVVVLRAIKTDSEIQTATQAQAYVDDVLIDVVKKYGRVGVTEQELAFEIETVLRKRGAHGLSFDAVVAFAENSAVLHHEPSDRTLQINENILIDCGITLNGYCSDMTRNFVYGEASDEYRKKFDLLLGVQKKLLHMASPGQSIADWHNTCVEMLGDDGQYFTHALGHGVGLDIHENPKISPSSEDMLNIGQVVTCEPGLYYPGQFGIRIEDLLVITESGCDILTKTPRELVQLDA